MIESVPSDVNNGSKGDFDVFVCWRYSGKPTRPLTISDVKETNMKIVCVIHLQPVELLIVGKLENKLIDHSINPQCPTNKL